MLNVGATVKNQISGDTYDATGNLTATPPPASASYTYDAENRLTTAAGVTYIYDGDGKRVQKSNGKLYWYGAGGDPLDESDGSGNFTAEYIFFGGKRIARLQLPAGTVNYYFADHLGTARIVANATGTVLDDSDFYPFGGERIVLSSSGNNYKFTGKERDTESGLDDFGARFYVSNYARWLTPDWSAGPTAVPYADFTDPQTLNQYSYVRDNPLAHADLDGHEDGAVSGFLRGFTNALKSDLLFGTGREEATTKAQSNGQAAGDVVAAVGGVIETLVGGGLEVGGLALDATGVGAVIGVPAQVVGTGVIAHGISTAVAGAGNLLKSGVDTMQPGPNAGDSIPARGPQRNFTPAERDAVNKAGQDTGCHTCGAKHPGTKSGSFVPDHQPPSGVNQNNKPQRLYPQCQDCSRTQGGQVSAAKKKIKPQ